MTHFDFNHQVASSGRLSIRHSLVIGGLWVLVASLLACARLTHPAFGIQGDLPLHYHITRSFAQSLAEGDLLPRWAGLLDGGRGDALFTFYPPLSYLLSAAPVTLLGIEILTSLKLVTLLFLIIAQASAYLLAREFFTARRSLLVSMIFVLLPAYPLIALHRAFFANALALSLAPLTLLGAHLLLDGRRRARGLTIFALSFSAVILTHVITTYLCGIAIGMMTIIHLLRVDRREPGWSGALRLVGAGVIVCALTAFFLWPQRVEIDWIQIGLQIVQQDYRNYFLFAKASDSSRYRQAWADLNHVTSLITIAQTLTAALLGLICYRRLKLDRSPGSDPALVWFGLALAAFGLFIALPISDALWKYLPGLKFIQFPWRFQPLVALGCSLIAASAFDEWKKFGRGARNLIAAGLTWVMIVNCAFTVILLRLNEPGVTRAQVTNLLHSPDNQPVTIEEGRRLQNEDDLKYMPYAANQIYFRPKGSDFNLYPPAKQPGGLSLIAGRGRVVSQQLGVAHREFKVENEEPALARIETYHYPHWVARIDGREVRVDVERNDGPNQGLMSISLPPGEHLLTLRFEVRNMGEKAARLISLAGWLMFIAWLIWRTALWSRARARRREKSGE
jgi:hypothetical protein